MARAKRSTKKKPAKPTKKPTKRRKKVTEAEQIALANGSLGYRLFEVEDGIRCVFWTAIDGVNFSAFFGASAHPVTISRSRVTRIYTDEEQREALKGIGVGKLVEVTVAGSANSSAKKGRVYSVTNVNGAMVTLRELKANSSPGWVAITHLEPVPMKVGDKTVIAAKPDAHLGNAPGNLSQGDFCTIKAIREEEVAIGDSGVTKKVVLVDLECMVTGDKGTFNRDAIRFFDGEDQKKVDETLIQHRRVLESSRQRLLEQDSLIKELLKKPTQTSLVLKIHRDGTDTDEKSWVLMASGNIHNYPRQFEVENGVPLKEGMVVTLAQTGQIEGPAVLWDQRHVRGYIAEDQVEGEQVVYVRQNDPDHGDKKEGFSGHLPVYAGGLTGLKRGDLVEITREGAIAKKVADAKPKEVSVPKSMARVTWDEIGGVDKAKKELIDAIETPKKFPALFKAYGSNMPKGVELFGPPGCGKTLIAKAVVTMMADLHGSEVVHESAFIYVKGPEILDKYVGEAEAKIRKMFADAREHYKKHNYNAILFIDEADAVLMKRGSNRSSDVDKTIVPMFLAEMDGMDEGGPFLLLATNMPNNLDEAVVRPGRIDRSIEIPRPGVESAYEIFQIHLKKVPLKVGTTVESVARSACIQLFDHTNHCRSQVSGAMIANIVQRGAMRALAQDVLLGNETPSGVDMDDLTSAMADIDVAGEARKSGGRTVDAHA